MMSCDDVFAFRWNPQKNRSHMKKLLSIQAGVSLGSTGELLPLFAPLRQRAAEASFGARQTGQSLPSGATGTDLFKKSRAPGGEQSFHKHVVLVAAAAGVSSSSSSSSTVGFWKVWVLEENYQGVFAIQQVVPFGIGEGKAEVT